LENRSSASSTLLVAHYSILPSFLFFRLLNVYCSFTYFLSYFGFVFLFVFELELELELEFDAGFEPMFFALTVYFIDGCYV
jgi:hypothetical protein